MKARLKFSKHGVIRYVGHLDIMRYFQKCIRRSGLPVRYSEGFSPHQVMSFASPLGTGLLSDGEYVDIEFTGDIDPCYITDRLNAVMNEGIAVQKTVIVADRSASAMSLVDSADYEVICHDVSEAARELMARENIEYTSFSKKAGEYKTKDIRPLIHSLSYDEGRLRMRIAQGSSSNLKPRAVLEIMGINVPDSAITRKELYARDGSPLSEAIE